MNIHPFIAYINYKLRAKKLHGVHSPFAYSFSEDILYSDKYSLPGIIAYQSAPANKYTTLVSRIKNCYHYKEPSFIAFNDDVPASSFMIMSDNNPGHWLQLLNKMLPSIPSDSVFIIPGIHNTRRHSAKWKRIVAHPRVMMSIDVYGLGLIFFRKEFKEKQHFILSY